MMYKLIGLFVVFIAFTNAQKTRVQVYYESLCEDSQRFITQQLYPALVQQGLKDFIDVEWVPFGKSSFDIRGSDVIFTCHHGPNECYGNKVHACAIDHIQANSYQIAHTRESLTLDYINCLMKFGKNFPDNVYPAERCAKEVGIQIWQPIIDCANSTQGSQLLKKFGEQTAKLNPPLTSVPFITFRYMQNPQTQKLSLENFVKAACGEISLPKPQVCAAHSAGVMMTATSVLTPLIVSVAFVLKHIFA